MSASAAVTGGVAVDTETRLDRALLQRSARVQRLVYLFGPVCFALPFLVLALFVNHHHFVSTEHSRAAYDSILAHQRGALDVLGRNASPLVALFAYVVPGIAPLRVLAALAAGAAVWVVWRQLGDVPIPSYLRALLLTAFATTPALLFLSDAAASQMITLLLLLVAWRLYLRFVTESITWNGFAAGLILAVAFFSDFLSIAYVIPFAIAVPATLFRGAHGSKDESFRAGVTGLMVIALPALLAFLGWCYVNWVLKGNPLAFSNDISPGASVNGGLSAAAFTGWDRSLDAMRGDMIRVPLYPLVGLLLLLRNPRTIAAYAFPLLLTTVTRIAGYAQQEAFVLGTYLGFALVGVITAIVRRPQALRRDRRSRIGRAVVVTLLTFASAGQLFANLSVPLRSADAVSWRQAVLDGDASANNSADAHVADRLATLPAHSVLADDNAYAFIARAGTAIPYVLPDDARFELSRSNPTEWVQHILVNTNVTAYDHLSQTFSGDVDGFFVDHEWNGWRLLTRYDVPPVMS